MTINAHAILDNIAFDRHHLCLFVHLSRMESSYLCLMAQSELLFEKKEFKQCEEVRLFISVKNSS